MTPKFARPRARISATLLYARRIAATLLGVTAGLRSLALSHLASLIAGCLPFLTLPLLTLALAGLLPLALLSRLIALLLATFRLRLPAFGGALHLLEFTA